MDFCTIGVWQRSHETVSGSVLENDVAYSRRLFPKVWYLCLGMWNDPWLFWFFVCVFFTLWVFALKWLVHLFQSLPFTPTPTCKSNPTVWVDFETCCYFCRIEAITSSGQMGSLMRFKQFLEVKQFCCWFGFLFFFLVFKCFEDFSLHSIYPSFC